jgi:hypothetical protein
MVETGHLPGRCGPPASLHTRQATEPLSQARAARMLFQCGRERETNDATATVALPGIGAGRTSTTGHAPVCREDIRRILLCGVPLVRDGVQVGT